MFLENWRSKNAKCFQKSGGARNPNVFRKLEEQENQMFLESWRSKKTKCF
jgi:hypothetical protein